jgi:choice-of-anchor C domain-containing protein
MSATRTIVALLLMASVLCLGTSVGQANLITNGSFEEGTEAPGSSWRVLYAGEDSADDITGWIVTTESIDWYGTCWTPAEGKRSIDLSGNRSGALTSTPFKTIPGLDYEVVFYMSGNFDPNFTGDKSKTLIVSAASQSWPFTFIKPDDWSTSNMNWQKIIWTFTANADFTELTFASSSGSACGPAIDNVSVMLVPLPGAIPLPPGVLLLGTGLLCLAGFRRFRKR